MTSKKRAKALREKVAELNSLVNDATESGLTVSLFKTRADVIFGAVVFTGEDDLTVEVKRETYL